MLLIHYLTKDCLCYTNGPVSCTTAWLSTNSCNSWFCVNMASFIDFFLVWFCFSGLQPSSKSSSFPVRMENSVPIVPQNQSAQSLQIQPSMLTQVRVCKLCLCVVCQGLIVLKMGFVKWNFPLFFPAFFAKDGQRKCGRMTDRERERGRVHMDRWKVQLNMH